MRKYIENTINRMAVDNTAFILVTVLAFSTAYLAARLVAFISENIVYGS